MPKAHIIGAFSQAGSMAILSVHGTKKAAVAYKAAVEAMLEAEGNNNIKLDLTSVEMNKAPSIEELKAMLNGEEE